MNRKQYNSDPRYAKVLEKMDLLQIMDITTTRQSKNGTITWKLPIKNKWNDGSLIEVASFKSGYVRNNNSCYTNYQLNKRGESEPQYYPEYDCNGKKTDKYVQFTTRTCKLIPNEIDRLEYLIAYCLKNYYIKYANFIAGGEYVPKWYHEHQLAGQKNGAVRFKNTKYEIKDSTDCGHYDKIQSLEENLDDAVGTIVKHETYYVKLEDKIRDLENKLQSIIRTARH